MQTLTVRRANEGDLEHLVKFTVDQVKEAEGAIKSEGVVSLGVRKALLDDSLAMYWVLVDDNDVPVGSASVSRDWSDWNAGYYWWLQSMYVSAGFRGQRGMAKLILAIKTQMQQDGGLELRLYVNKDNESAKAAYEHNGFRQSVYEVMVQDDSE